MPWLFGVSAFQIPAVLAAIATASIALVGVVRHSRRQRRLDEIRKSGGGARICYPKGRGLVK